MAQATNRRSTLGICGLLQRTKHAIVRRIVPSARERHRLELLIGPVGYWQQVQDYQFSFLTQMGLKPHHALLDIGCGPLSGGLALIPYLEPGNYVGLDLRGEAISEGYIQLAKAGLAGKNPSLVVSASFGRDELGDRRFDYIWASQVLYHLDEAGIYALLDQVTNRLRPGGAFYGDIIGYPNKVQNGSEWRGFSFHLHSTRFLATAGRDRGLRMTDLGSIGNYGYPPEIALKTNVMLQFRKGTNVP